MFDDIPDNYKIADRRRPRRRLALHAKATRTRAVRRSCSRAITWPAASIARSRPAAAARTAASSSTLPGSRRSSPTRAEHIKKKLPSMYHQFKQLADIDITKEPMEVGPTTHYMMGGVRVDGDTPDVATCPDSSPAANAPPASRRQSARAAIRSPTCWSSASARANSRPSSPRTTAGRRSTMTKSRTLPAGPWHRSTRTERQRRALQDPARFAGDDAGPGRHRPP